MAVNRVLYATQTAVAFSGGTGVTGHTTRLGWVMPTQTASADETIPQDDVLVLGKLGGVARLQKDVASCKASVKMYMCSGFTSDSSTSYWNDDNQKIHPVCPTSGATMDNFLNSMIVAAQVGIADNVYVSSNPTATAGVSDNDGFALKGILTSIGIDASKGAFPMLDLAWEGVGRLETLSMGTDSTLAGTHGGDWHITAAEPLTSKEVEPHGASTDTIASVKFSYDLPTESLSRLGGTIIGNSTDVATDNKVFSKPPYKASLTADGQDLSAIAVSWGTTASVQFNGNFTAAIDPNGLNVSTRSFSQNVGDVGATYNVTAEGTKANFTG